jgi:DNA polymerase-3 subunit alpha
MVGDFVAEKFVKTKRGELMKFGTFLDIEGKFFDTVHFPPSLVQYPLRGAGIYLIKGKVVQEFGCPSLEVIRCAKIPLKPDPGVYNGKCHRIFTSTLSYPCIRYL